MDFSKGLLGSSAQNIYAQTGENVGSVVGRLFGLKDPVLERRTILSQVDYTDPASIRAAAQALMAQGDVDAGMQLAGQARQIEQQERQFGIQKRGVELQEKAAERAEEQAFLNKLEKSPRAALADIVAMEDGPKKTLLLAQAAQSMDAARINEEYKQAQIDALKAQARASGQKGYEVIKDTLGNPIARFNKGTGEVEEMPGVRGAGATGAGATDKPKLTDEELDAILRGENTETKPRRSSSGQMGRNRSQGAG